MPVPLGPSSHRPSSPHTTMLPPGPLTPPPEEGWTWPLPENAHRNAHGNNINGISSRNNRGNVYGDIHSSTHRITTERPAHIHNNRNLSSNDTHNANDDILYDETDPTVQAGYRHCLREAVRWENVLLFFILLVLVLYIILYNFFIDMNFIFISSSDSYSFVNSLHLLPLLFLLFFYILFLWIIFSLYIYFYFSCSALMFLQ